MKKTITAQEVANHAGVSLTTVSFVMNNVEKANISLATRERVLNAAEELGYVPHAAAKSLARGRSSNIALFLVQPHQQVFSDPYIPNIITGIHQAVKAEEYRILVEHIHHSNDIHKVLDMLKSGEIAGAIVTHSVWDTATQKKLARFPIVSLTQANTEFVHCVTIDQKRGIEQLARHIASLGRNPIGIIAYASADSYNIQRRLKIFTDSLAQENISLETRYIRYGAYEPRSAFIAMQSLLDEHPRVELVYCMNDMMAVGTLSALHSANIRIPEDIAILGYDDIRVSEFLHPPLTTVRAPEIALGETAANTLLQLIHEETSVAQIQLLPTELVIRQSCGAHLI